MEIDKWKDDGERPMEIPDKIPIHFAVNDDQGKEVDIGNGEMIEIPWFSTWFIMDENVHVPIYAYQTEEGHRWNSMRRDYGNAEYHDPTEAFWYCVGHQFEHWEDAEIDDEFEDMEIYEKVFFDQLINAFLEMNMSPEVSVVVEYATEKYGGEN